MIVNVLSRLEQSPVLEVMAKEVVGINLPKTAIVRSRNELMDVAVNEFGNTVGFFGGGMILSRLLDFMYAQVAKSPKLKGLSQQKNALQWLRLGKSVAVSSVLFSLMWGMPFLRNYLTAQRTGTVDYTKVIGAKKSSAADPALESAKRSYLSTLAKTLGLGVLAAIGGVGFAKTAIKKSWNYNTFAGGLFNTGFLKKLAFKEGKFQNFNNFHAMWVWGLPAYGGWLHASRDGYERKEQLLKFAGFMIGFFVPNMVFEKVFTPKFKQALGKRYEEFLGKDGKLHITHEEITRRIKSPKMKKAVTNLWLRRNLWGLGTSIVLLGATPPLLNIWLTQKRLERDTALNSSYKADASLPAGDLTHKPFEQFARSF